VVDPGRDTIAVDGRPIARLAAREWLVLHKPAGVLTTRSDPEGRPTVFDLVPDRPGLTYVGRLDYMTEGVLLFTTDGDAAHRLTHPSRAVERTYVAVVRGNAPAAVRMLRQGLTLDDGPVEATAVAAQPLGNRRWDFELTIAEGRTREVRRICEALELVVERLARVRFGPVRLGTLPSGQVRPLSAAERRVIDALTGAASPLVGGVGDEMRAVGRDTSARRERPRDDRPRDERPRDARSQDARPRDRARDDRPRGDGPRGGAPRAPARRADRDDARAPARGPDRGPGRAAGRDREPRPPGRVPGGGRNR
jgi:23S rRNA pseudouridine2605 synthase